MGLAAISPIPGHAVFLLLLELALLLLVARIGAVVARSLGLPAVVGELAAGLVLGPSVFGHYAPAAFGAVFPETSEQFHLLETVGLLGMVLLLLLTGLETDLKLLRNLGRAAVVASVLGMIVPFALGFGLGLWMPDEYLAQPERRGLFAAFLATALSISAMPVIAKILMDLDLTRRNIGLVILSAGVVDDTSGWLVLSVIAGAATQGGSVQLAGLGLTLLLMALFLALVAFVAYPFLRLFMRRLARTQSSDGELVLVVVFAFVCAALTERIGIHAVFGAFVAGTVLRQIPYLRAETVHRLEGFVFTILAPVFFGTVGLKVDLWTLAGGGGTMLAIVLGIACVGKIVGAGAGGLWGGLSFWESMSIAVAMNARGAMELVVASIGLSLGLLNAQMFSIIVVVAIATSFLAPVLLRLTMRMVRMTGEEETRILVEESRGIFDPNRLRVLVATSGSKNAGIAARVAYVLAARTSEPVEVLYVDERGSAFERLLHVFGKSEAKRNIEEHLAQLRALAGTVPVRARSMSGKDPARAVVEEAGRGFDLIVTGASTARARLGGGVLASIVEAAPCHVAIVKPAAFEAPLRRVFVPVDGSSVSRIAAEFALRYAESAGATLTLGLISERGGAVHRDSLRQRPADSGDEPGASHPDAMGAAVAPSIMPPPSVEQDLARISAVFRVAALKPEVVRIDYDHGIGSVANAIIRGGHDLVVLGAENRAVRQSLFFGHENERIIALERVTTVVLVPHTQRRR